MKVKLHQILNAVPILRAWLGGGADAPRFRPRLAYRLSLMAKELDEHLAVYQESVQRILRENALEVTEAGFSFAREDGTVDQEAIRRVEEAIRELAQTEVELRRAARLSLQDLEDAGARLTVAEIDAISWMLEVEDESSPGAV